MFLTVHLVTLFQPLKIASMVLCCVHQLTDVFHSLSVVMVSQTALISILMNPAVQVVSSSNYYLQQKYIVFVVEED